jgi:hypothetical protein
VSDDSLDHEVALLCDEFERLDTPNIGPIAERLRDLVGDGYGLAAIERTLRAHNAPIFLVGLPWESEDEIGFYLFHPTGAVDPSLLRFSLWIGINGPDEVERVLAEASISASANVANLDVTGFIAQDDDPDDPFGPDDGSTIRELLGWLLLDAPTWTARRDVVLGRLDVLATGDVLPLLTEMVDSVELDAQTTAFVDEVTGFIRRALADGPRHARQTCRPLVLEAVLAFMEAGTWVDAADVYRSYHDELNGDLAAEVLAEFSSNARYTGGERAVVEAHARFLELAWEHGVDGALEFAQREFPRKSGTATTEDHLLAYFEAPDLERACDVIRAAPPGLLQLGQDALGAALQRVGASDDVWRFGLLEGARDHGVDAAYRHWAEIRSIETSTNVEEAVGRLVAILDLESGCLRDRALELLLTCYGRLGDESAQLATAQELCSHRSLGSPPSRRPLDFADLGVLLSKRGDISGARAAFIDAISSSHLVHDPVARSAFWLRSGIFHRDYDDDLPLALHSFRAAAEDCAAANDALSAAYAFGELSMTYRSVGRLDMAEVYCLLAERVLDDSDEDESGVAGSWPEVTYAVDQELGLTAFTLGNYVLAGETADWILDELLDGLDGEQRCRTERLAVACALENGHLQRAHEIVARWSEGGLTDWATLGRAAIGVAAAATAAPDRRINPRRQAYLSGLEQALVHLGASPAGVRPLFRRAPASELRRAILDTLAGVHRGDPLLPTRLFGEHEASAWAARSQRESLAPARIHASGGVQLGPLRQGAPWHEVIARYHDLNVWRIPDLAVLGPILDRWSLRSRFGAAVRLNPAEPLAGSLNAYFFRTDPEGHLDGVVSGCSYLPDGDLLICSLAYTDDLFHVSRIAWDEETERIREGLLRSSLRHDDVDALARQLSSSVQARDRVLLEWIIGHEIGHAHFGHSMAAIGADALALEEEADSFFLGIVLDDDGLGEVFLALSMQLRALYAYDCAQQLSRPLTLKEVEDLSVTLDATPDASGHRPLVFRLVRLLQSILREHPELEDSSYIDDFAASIERR